MKLCLSFNFVKHCLFNCALIQTPRDPMFEPEEGNGLTYAEMSATEKNKISHRARAFSVFRDFLNESFTSV
jgi:Xanthosine triphosphate pyrophosphatase